MGGKSAGNGLIRAASMDFHRLSGEYHRADKTDTPAHRVIWMLGAHSDWPDQTSVGWLMSIKPIRNDNDLRRAFKRLEEVWQAKPNTPEYDEMEMLTTLIEFAHSV